MGIRIPQRIQRNIDTHIYLKLYTMRRFTLSFRVFNHNKACGKQMKKKKKKRKTALRLINLIMVYSRNLLYALWQLSYAKSRTCRIGQGKKQKSKVYLIQANVCECVCELKLRGIRAYNVYAKRHFHLSRVRQIKDYESTCTKNARASFNYTRKLNKLLQRSWTE